jgi:hypothetical protein
MPEQTDHNSYSYTFHKTYTTLVTEPRGQDEQRKWVRVFHTVTGDVTITIDLDSLAELMARKALLSSGGKSRTLNGVVRATTHNVQRKQEDLPHRDTVNDRQLKQAACESKPR